MRAVLWAVAAAVAWSAPAVARDLTAEERVIIEAAVKDRLKDPTSPLFKWMPLDSDNEDVYCGLVNAKNSYGAYIGFAPYLSVIVVGAEGVAEAALVGMASADPQSPESVTIRQMCADAGYEDFRVATE